MRPYRVALLLITIVLAACAVEQEYSRTPRTAVEQLLLTQAIDQYTVLFYVTWAATDSLAPP